MKVIAFLGLIAIAFFSKVQAQESNVLPANKTVYVYEKDATLWSPEHTGFTYTDCINPAPGSRAMSACDGRRGWPPGGSELTVKRSIVRVDGNDYAYVQTNGLTGWTSVNYLNTRDGRPRFAKNGNLYSAPGYDYVRCKNNPEDLVCKNRTYIREGTALQKYAPTEVSVGDETYVMVEYDNSGEKRTGWVQKSSLSSISQGGSHAETQAGVCKDCQSRSEPPPVETSDITEMRRELEDANPNYKNSEQMEKFACIYSSSANFSGGFSQDKFCRFYKGPGSNFKAQIDRAAAAFSLPPSVIGCTLLIESNMHFNSNERDEYRGYGQFGRAAVTELGRRVKKPPYRQMWEKYTSRPTSDFNDQNIRRQKNVEVSVAAVAMYMKWLLEEQIPDAGCVGCSKQRTKPNLKDMYLAVAGYNWSPWGLHRIAKKSTTQMLTSHPPPAETRSYLSKMERCLAPGNFSKFNRSSTSPEYKARGEKCETPCP